MTTQEMKKKIEGLAFPKPDNEEYYPQDGLTKREYFAGLAMQGFCACPNLEISREGLAIESVRQADELLKQLQND